jgi:hypothetical protein
MLSNNPDKARQLERLGVRVANRVPTAVHLTPDNARHLATKAARGSHTLTCLRLPDRSDRGAPAGTVSGGARAGPDGAL